MQQFHRLEIPESILNDMIEHARSDLPNECCGLLAGSMREGVGLVSRRFPIRNDEASPREYLSNPKDMFAAFRAMKEDRLELLAIYHSHPASSPVPSLRDVERNTYGESVMHLIVSLAAMEPRIQSWWLGQSDYREAEWTISRHC